MVFYLPSFPVWVSYSCTEGAQASETIFQCCPVKIMDWSVEITSQINPTIAAFLLIRIIGLSHLGKKRQGEMIRPRAKYLMYSRWIQSFDLVSLLRVPKRPFVFFYQPSEKYVNLISFQILKIRIFYRRFSLKFCDLVLRLYHLSF